jgi:uncharacterized protein YkwD
MLTRRRILALAPAAFVAGCTATVPPSITATDTTPEHLTTGQILAQINAVRAANGVRPWSYNPRLAAAARTQADLMASKDQLSHNLGVTLRERVTNAGYEGAVGENVAGGQRTLEAAIQGWLASPGHRSTLLSTKFVEFGLAVSRGAKKKEGYGVYWALIAGGSFEAWKVT